MAGPSLSGPLSGWTASTLTPKSAPPVPVQNEQKKQAYQARKKLADDAEAAARATGDPAKLQEAYRLFLQAEAFRDRAPGESVVQQFRSGVEKFQERNPSVQLQPQTLSILQAPEDKLEETIFGVPQDVQQATAPALPAGSFGSVQSARGSGGGPSAYNLTDEELGVGLGPDPRAVVKPQTPLESLLSAIYPDAATSGGSTAGGDPRGQSQQPSVINNILANLGTAPSQTSGYIPAPALTSAGVGAQIASTIPGAPPFLAGAINNVSGYGGGFVPAPAAARPAFDPLIGISAISAEQRIQAAQLAKEKAAQQAAYFAQLQQRQRAQQQADQIARQRVGGLVSQSGWNSPSFSPGGWVPNFPSY